MPTEFRSLFEELLNVVDLQRPGYRDALGLAAEPEEIRRALQLHSSLPYLIDIYSRVGGTPRGISDQSLMDLIPGYRLVELHEIESGDEWEGQRIVPLLSNYSSDHIAFMEGGDALWMLNHDEFEAHKRYDNPITFLKTVLECYRSGAYFLDADGYLDYNMILASEIRKKLNPGCA